MVVDHHPFALVAEVAHRLGDGQGEAGFRRCLQEVGQLAELDAYVLARSLGDALGRALEIRPPAALVANGLGDHVHAHAAVDAEGDGFQVGCVHQSHSPIMSWFTPLTTCPLPAGPQ